MKKFSKSVVVVLMVIAAVMVWWKVTYPSASWRYKIMVEIETPDGIKRGSAVRELAFDTEPHIFPEQAGFSFRNYGEAVVVDLGKRGLLFVLMANEMHDAFPNPYYHIGRVERYWEYINHYSNIKHGSTAPLPEDKWPRMVMFKDINDPKSVTLVKGGGFDAKKQDFDPVDEFETLFGAGVKLRQITIEVTDEPVTWGMVDRYLPEIFHSGFQEWWNTLDLKQKTELSNMYNFKQGEK